MDKSIGEMFIQGASMVGVGKVIHNLTDVKPSPSTVSRVFHKLEDEFTAWKTRKLAPHYLSCFADGTYFSVIYDDQGCKMPILAVIVPRLSRRHGRTIRTTNVIERLFKEVKKRSHKMSAVFRNEQSCLLMFYALIRGMTFHRIIVET